MCPGRAKGDFRELNVIRSFSTTQEVMEIAERRCNQLGLDFSKYISSLILRDDTHAKVLDITDDLKPKQEMVEPAPVTSHIPRSPEAEKVYEEFLKTENNVMTLASKDMCIKRGHAWKIIAGDDSGKVTDAICERCGKSWMY
jgi:hypothetical protein